MTNASRTWPCRSPPRWRRTRKSSPAATHYCSATAIATVDVYHKFGFPIIVWGAVLPDITYRNKYAEVHRVNGTMINQNDANAELISKLGYKTVAVIHDTTDYGKGHNEYFSKSLAKLGGKIVGTFGVTADQQDFTAELTQIKALNPEVIYFGGLTPIGVRIRSQMDKLGIKAVFDGTSGIVSDAFIQGLGPLAEGALAFREGAPTEKLPGGKFFLEKYAAQKYDNPPEAYGAFAYAAMDLILDSIEKVGPDRKKVIAELANVKDRDSIVGKITFDDHGQNTVAVDHQICGPGRQVRGVGRQRIRLGQAQAARTEIAISGTGGTSSRPASAFAVRAGSERHGCGAARPIRHERAHARHDVCARRGRLHAVLRRARRHQVLPWRRADGRRLHGAGDLYRTALGRASVPPRCCCLRCWSSRSSPWPRSAC